MTSTRGSGGEWDSCEIPGREILIRLRRLTMPILWKTECAEAGSESVASAD
ncbi:MAG: hypothetical protein NTY87_05060 [Planctomycetia bacterium]|nr:hypothetical protein [Planctomycetia bacterium]